MKKLICSKDIQEAVRDGKKILYVDENTIITASAEDEAKTAGIEICYGEAAACCKTDSSCTTYSPVQAPSQDASSEISSELIYKVLKNLSDKGMLGDIFRETSAAPDVPYLCEKDPSGLKVVRGNTVRMDEFFEGNPRVTYQEIIDKNDSKISSGILVIDHDTYEWTQTYDENDYVIEGTMTVTINGRSYTANAGDSIFIPNGATVVMGSKDHYCKVFYNTYPSNWADLL